MAVVSLHHGLTPIIAAVLFGPLLFLVRGAAAASWLDFFRSPRHLTISTRVAPTACEEELDQLRRWYAGTRAEGHDQSRARPPAAQTDADAQTLLMMSKKTITDNILMMSEQKNTDDRIHIDSSDGRFSHQSSLVDGFSVQTSEVGTSLHNAVQSNAWVGGVSGVAAGASGTVSPRFSEESAEDPSDRHKEPFISSSGRGGNALVAPEGTEVRRVVDRAAAVGAAFQSAVAGSEPSRPGGRSLLTVTRGIRSPSSSSSSSSSSPSSSSTAAAAAAAAPSESGGLGAPCCVEMLRKLEDQTAELEQMMAQIVERRLDLKRVSATKYRLNKRLDDSHIDWEKILLPNKTMAEAARVVRRCNGRGVVVQRRVAVWKGYACDASNEDIQLYMRYASGGHCPDDWFRTQALLFQHNCFSLPHRRCFAATPQKMVEPLPFPRAMFTQASLLDDAVRWPLHSCKSFACLNARLVGDCRLCFNLSMEANRWRTRYRHSLTIKEVLRAKRGALRLGLDVGGGTGSFAAHMARYNVTVMTTAMNIETVVGRKQGLPYMETIALRGLIPLHLPHKARLPLFDNTLDIIHSVNSIKYLPMLEFEELLFEWDRVLRVGGVLWFEMFYAPLDEMPVYISLINLLSYRRLHWHVLPKPDPGERKGAHVYLNCLLEKPMRSDAAKRKQMKTMWLWGG